MNEINKIILESVDEDIKDLFSKIDSDLYHHETPLKIHIARHLKLISEALKVKK